MHLYTGGLCKIWHSLNTCNLYTFTYRHIELVYICFKLNAILNAILLNV